MVNDSSQVLFAASDGHVRNPISSPAPVGHDDHVFFAMLVSHDGVPNELLPASYLHVFTITWTQKEFSSFVGDRT